MPKLYVIGLGPGDPELITVKSVEVLRKMPVVFLPYSTGTNRSLAYSIIARYVSDNAEIVFLGFPMSSNPDPNVLNDNAELICRKLNHHGSGVFAVLGDPALYSTFYRIKHSLIKVCPELSIEVIPGVTAMSACAARIVEPLVIGDEALALIPATRGELIKRVLGIFETIVLYKANNLNDHVLDNIKNDGRYNVVYARRCFMSDEEIIRGIPEHLSDYFSTMILHIRENYLNRI
jgi:precorrin-2/cobalt-factor-2 C20-methyltransferase